MSWRRASACLLAVGLLNVGCGPEVHDVDPTSALSEAAWPTEVWSGESGDTRKVVIASLMAGVLDSGDFAAVAMESFRGEALAGREFLERRVESGVVITTWSESGADLEAEAFVQSWNDWLADLGEMLTVETHTWELQLRPREDDARGLEAKIALWAQSRVPDGRLREERFYLVFDLVDREGWKIDGIRTEDARTTVAPGPYFRDITNVAVPPGYDQIGAQIYTDGGPVLADFDDDGDPDLFLPRIHASARLYENDGTGIFTDVTARWGLELISLRQGTNSGLFVDFDDDGKLDLVIGAKLEGLRLFQNQGARFREVTGDELLGGEGEWETITAADYDGDGLIDLYLCNYNLIDPEHQPESYVDAWDGLPNVLLRNLGGGKFEDVTVAAGLRVDRDRWSYAASWADYDVDGDLDLYVANDYGGNSLFRNRGDGTFEDVAAEVGAKDRGNGMGMSWVDVDGDLDLDLYLSNMQSFAGNRITRLESFPGTPEQQELYRRFAKGNTLLANTGDGAFEDVTAKAGVKGAFWAWGNVPFDYDADGDQDVYVCGGFYTGASSADT